MPISSSLYNDLKSIEHRKKEEKVTIKKYSFSEYIGDNFISSLPRFGEMTLKERKGYYSLSLKIKGSYEKIVYRHSYKFKSLDEGIEKFNELESRMKVAINNNILPEGGVWKPGKDYAKVTDLMNSRGIGSTSTSESGK